MEFRQLECFVTVATLGNITRASEVLHISQPAVSKSIQLLEADLGIELFERKGKRISLNAAGKKVMKDAKEILARYQSIYQTCQQLQQENSAKLTLMVSAASEYLPGLLAAFNQQYPGISLTILQSTPRQDQADVFISSAIRGCDEPAHRSILCEEIGIALLPEHPLAAQTSISLRELSNYPLLSMRSGNDMRRIEDRYAAEAGVSFQHAFECDTPATLRSLIRSGLGPALVPTKTWPSLYDGSVRILPVRNQKCVRYINVQILNPDKASENARILFAFITRYFGAK